MASPDPRLPIVWKLYAILSATFDQCPASFYPAFRAFEEVASGILEDVAKDARASDQLASIFQGGKDPVAKRAHCHEILRWRKNYFPSAPPHPDLPEWARYGWANPDGAINEDPTERHLRGANRQHDEMTEQVEHRVRTDYCRAVNPVYDAAYRQWLDALIRAELAGEDTSNYPKAPTPHDP